MDVDREKVKYFVDDYGLKEPDQGPVLKNDSNLSYIYSVNDGSWAHMGDRKTEIAKTLQEHMLNKS